MREQEIKVKYKVLNNEFRKNISDMGKSVNSLNKEFNLQKEQMKLTGSEFDKLNLELDKNQKLQQMAKEKVELTTKALENARKLTGENSEETRKWSDALLTAQKNETFYGNKIIEVNKKLDEQKKATSDNAKAHAERAKTLDSLKGKEEELKNKSEILTKEYELQKGALKSNASESEKLALKQEYLAKQMQNSGDSVRNLEKQLEVAKQQYGANSKEVKELEKALLDAKLSNQQFSNSFKESIDKLKQFEDATARVGGKMKAIGDNMTKFVTLPIVAGVGASVKAASDFESSFAGVKKTVDELVDANGKVIISYADLEKGVRDMAKELPSSANEISNVAEAAGQLGITTDNVLSFTRTMIDMGVSTDMSAETAATSLAKLANITGMNQNDFDKLGSSLVYLGNNFATTEGKIVDMSLRLSGAGSQLGLTEAQILGIAAGLSSVGLEADAGGSSFSKLMIDMKLASETGGRGLEVLDTISKNTGVSLTELKGAAHLNGKELEALAQRTGVPAKEMKELSKAAYDGESELRKYSNVIGITTDEFEKLMQTDPSKALELFIQGLANAEERGMSTIQMLDEMGIKEVRLRDTLLRAAGASDVLTGAISGSEEAWRENSALTEEASKRYETFESKLKVLKNKLVDLAISVGGPFMDAMSSLIDILTPVLEKLGEMAKKFSEADPAKQKLIVGIVATVAAIGPLLSIGGRLVMGISKISKVIRMLSGASGIMGLVSKLGFLISPAGLVVGAIAALVAGFVLLYNKCETFRNAVDAIAKWFMELPGKIGQWISETWQAFMQWAVDLNQWVNDTRTKFIEGIANWFIELPGKIGEWISNTWQAFMQWAVDLAQWAEDTRANFVESIVQWFKDLPGKIGFALGYLLGTIAKWGIDLVNWATTTGVDFVNEIVDWFKELPGKIAEWTVNTFNNIVEWGSNLISKAKEIGTNFLNAIVEFFTQLPGRVLSFITKTASNIAKWGADIAKKATEIGTNFLNNTIKFFSELPGKVWKWLVDTVSKVTQWGVNLFDKGKEAAKKLVSSVVDGVASLPSKMMEIGRNIVEGVWDGIQGAIGWFTSQVSSFFGGIVDGAKAALGINSPSRVFRDIVGVGIMEGVSAGIEEGTGDVEDTLDRAIGDVISTAEKSNLNSNMNIGVDFESEGMNTAIEKARNIMDIAIVNPIKNAVDYIVQSLGQTNLGQLQLAGGGNFNNLVSTRLENKDYETSRGIERMTAALEQKLDTLIENNNNAVITLDGKATVGYMAPEINRQLGTMAERGEKI